MAKKNMDILLGNILGDSTIIPQDKTDNPSEVAEEISKEEKRRKNVRKPNEPHWQHFYLLERTLIDYQKKHCNLVIADRTNS